MNAITEPLDTAPRPPRTLAEVLLAIALDEIYTSIALAGAIGVPESLVRKTLDDGGARPTFTGAIIDAMVRSGRLRRQERPDGAWLFACSPVDLGARP